MHEEGTEQGAARRHIIATLVGLSLTLLSPEATVRQYRPQRDQHRRESDERANRTQHLTPWRLVGGSAAKLAGADPGDGCGTLKHDDCVNKSNEH